MLFFLLCIVAGVVITLAYGYVIDYDCADDKKKKKYHSIAVIIMSLSVVAGIIALSFVMIPAGSVGVHDLFGSVAERELPAGLNIKHPLAKTPLFSIKTHEIKETSEVPSKEGLIVRLDVSILFKIMPYKASEIYRTLGLQYYNVIIIPQLRSVIRETTSNYEAKALYTKGRQNITNDIFEELEPSLLERGIILEKVLLRDLSLPLTVTEAIEQKLKAEQEAEQMFFVLQRETQEAERKRIEASGIADSQQIIDKSLTDEYLTWYWITHLQDHDSVIYVPIGEGGLPLFKQVVE